MNAAEIKSKVEAAMQTWPMPRILEAGPFVIHFVWLYHVMKASEGLLKAAIANSTGDLHSYYVEHLKEETGHASWLADDLRSIGIDVHDTQAPQTAIQMAGGQYYLINHVNPAALLGYMVVLECFPAPLDYVDQLEMVHGTDALRTFRFHAEHDVDHGADVLAMIDQLPDEDKKVVEQSAAQTCMYFSAHLHQLRKYEEDSER